MRVRVEDCNTAGRINECPARRLLQPSAFCPDTHPSCLHVTFKPAATREPDDLCGNQRYRRELLTMGIMVTETC